MSASESNTSQMFRVIDASLNRAAEGLRFLEDTTRFLLNDTALTEKLKTLRHTLVIGEWNFQKSMIQSRNSQGDVGAYLDVDGGQIKKDIPSAIVANSRRVQEALRTLEEMAKIAGEKLPVSAEKYQQARFEIYTVEKELVARCLRQDKVRRIAGLYAIIDTQVLKGRNHLEMANQIIRGGARIIQLRDKITIKKNLLLIAQELKNICAENNVLFIMNDALDIALAVGADGLHLGQEDLPVNIARKLSPIDMLIGCSVDNATQAKKAVADGADYVAVGAIFPTPTKDTTVVGLEVLRQVKQSTSAPLVAIGGITNNNLAEVKKAGADSIAIISAILNADSPEKSTREIIKIFEV